MDNVLNFQLKSEKSKGDVFYETIAKYPVGKIISYDQFKAITGFDVKGFDRGVIYDANKKLLRNHNKMLKNVRNVGYKIATPHEQLQAGAFRRVRAGRQIAKGTDELVNIDVSKLTDEERNRQIMIINHFSTMAQITRKRSFVSLEKTREAKRGIVEAEKEQVEVIREIDKMQLQLKSLRKRLG